MITLTGIHHASLIVADTGQSLAFYQEVLGLPVDPGRPDLGYPGAWLQIGNQQLHLLEVANPDQGRITPVHGGRDRHVAFEIEDIAALKQALTHAGIEFRLSRSGRAALFCHDPDGNALEFIQRQ